MKSKIGLLMVLMVGIIAFSAIASAIDISILDVQIDDDPVSMSGENRYKS